MEERLHEDLIKAMKEKDKETLNVLRSVKAAIQLEVINNKRTCCDDLILDVISQQIKMRKDSISEFTKASRQDLVDEYQKEIDILKKYLPEQLTEDELNKIIDDVFKKVNPSSIKDLGIIMKEITPLVKNRCDMKYLNERLRSRLN